MPRFTVLCVCLWYMYKYAHMYSFTYIDLMHIHTNTHTHGAWLHTSRTESDIQGDRTSACVCVCVKCTASAFTIRAGRSFNASYGRSTKTDYIMAMLSCWRHRGRRVVAHITFRNVHFPRVPLYRTPKHAHSQCVGFKWHSKYTPFVLRTLVQMAPALFVRF